MDNQIVESVRKALEACGAGLARQVVGSNLENGATITFQVVIIGDDKTPTCRVTTDAKDFFKFNRKNYLRRDLDPNELASLQKFFDQDWPGKVIERLATTNNKALTADELRGLNTGDFQHQVTFAKGQVNQVLDESWFRLLPTPAKDGYKLFRLAEDQESAT